MPMPCRLTRSAAVLAVLLAALPGGPVTAEGGSASLPQHEDWAAESAALAEMIDKRPLTLMRGGAAQTIMARAEPAEAGCAVRLADARRSRVKAPLHILRWRALAWSGRTAEGGVRLVFYDEAGRYPGDLITVSPGDAERFEAMPARVAAHCRGAAKEGARIMASDPAMPRGCGFVRLPQLRLFDEGTQPARPGARPRAALDVLSRESENAELEILLDQPSDAQQHIWDWSSADLSFVYAADGIGALQIAEAAISRDGTPIPTRHTIAIYGDTRARITLRGPADVLNGAREIGLTLLDAQGRTRASARFDVAAVLIGARRALDAAAWSCAGAAPAPGPGARAPSGS